MKKFFAKWMSVIFIPLALQTMVFAPAAPAATTVTLADTDALVFNRANGVTNLVGTGTAVNDVVLYKNVGTFGGIAIDAAIKTVALSGSISNYDNPGSASTATGYANNWMINTVGGYATFRFEFYQAGTYTGVNTGIPVVLQNVKITSIDIDSSGTGAYQYTDFTGFQKYSLMSPTNLAVQTVNITSGGVTTPGVRFIAAVSGARSSAPQDQVLVKYDSVQSIQMTFGNLVNGSTNYFGLVFGGWPGTGTPVEYPNGFNTPPTSSNTTQNVAATGDSNIPTSSFGNYSDADQNPFYQVKIVSVSSGTLEKSSDGVTWTTVAANSTILVSDIDKGYLRYNATGSSGNPVVTFYVHDGLSFSNQSNTLTLTLATNSQTINFSKPNNQTATGTIASGATATSGLTVTLTSSTTGVCTVSGLDIVIISTGTCVITATQSGDGTYSAATPVTQNFVITAGSSGTAQTITFPNPGTKMVSATAFASNAKASSGLMVTLTTSTPTKCSASGLNIVALATGNCTVTASQPGDGTYKAATPVDQTFAIVGAYTVPLTWTMGAMLTGSSTATLTGLVDHQGANTTWQICYKKTSSPTINSTTNELSSPDTCSTAASITSSDTQPISKSYNATSLRSGSTYYYQIIAWHNSSNKVYGQVFKFTPQSTSNTYIQKIQTNDPTSLTTTSATLNGQIYTTSTSTKVSFCLNSTYAIKSGSYMTLANCEQTLAQATSTQKDTDFSTTAAAAGLNPYTPYFYQTIATRTRNGSTTTLYGNIVRFVTDPDASSVLTLPATNVESTTATMNASVVPNGPTSTIKFCYSSASTSTSRTYGSSLNSCLNSGPQNASPSSASGLGSKSANLVLTNLTPGTYYYQVILSNTVGGTTKTYYGNIVKFINGAPTVTTLAASTINPSANTATLNGFFNTNGENTIPKFCYSSSSTSANGILSACDNSGPNLATPNLITASDSRTASAVLDISGLTSGSTYYYQAIGYNATDSSLVGYGEILSFVNAAAPTVITGDATSITSTQAVLPGSITNNGASARGSICVSRSNSNVEVVGVLDVCFLVLTEAADGTVISQTATGLANSTTYFYQAFATNALGTSFGAIKSFTTGAGAPKATTLAATSIALNGTVLNGNVSPGGATTTVKFCYIKTSSMPNTDSTSGRITDTCIYIDATNKTIASTAGLTAVSATLGTLTANSKYYFQVIATNTISGTTNNTYGEVLNFTVGAPVVVTNDATNVATDSATLNGTVSAGSSSATVKFCLSTIPDVETDGTGKMSDCYGANATATPKTPSTDSTIASGTASPTYSATSLVSGTTYYYQIVATNSTGTVYGNVVTFSVGAPVAVSSDATSITDTTAQLNGTIDPNNDSNVSGLFCISDSDLKDADGSLLTCLDTRAPDQSDFTGNSALTAYIGAANLDPGTDYYYQLSATGAHGYNLGAVVHFKTLYRVDFDANGGSGTMLPQTGSGASSTALSSNTFTAPGGYPTFTGWNTAKDGSGRAFSSTATYDFKANLTLYAQWTNTTYTLHYYVNPSDSDVTSSTVPADLVSAGTINLASSASGLARTGYRLSGWKIERTSTEYALGDSFNLSQNDTATALWSRYYTITFDKNTNGVRTISGSPSKATDDYVVGGTAVNLATQGTMSSSGYIFAGWGTTNDTTTVLSGPITVSTDTTLYAVWSDLYYTLTFDGNTSDGGSTSNQTGYGNQALTSNGFTKSGGYVFAGWSLTSNGSVAYTNGGTFNFSADTTLYAIWTKTYTVTFNGNSNTGGSTASQTASSSTTLNSNGYTKSGYSFSGWATSTNGSVVYANGASYPFTADITLYAKWTVTSSGGGSSGGSSTPTPTPTRTPTPGASPSPTPTPTASSTAKPSPTPTAKKVSLVSIPLITTNAKTANGSLVTLTQVTVKPTTSPSPWASTSVKPSTSPSPSASASASSTPKPTSSPSPSTSASSTPAPSSTPSPSTSSSSTSSPKPSASATPTSSSTPSTTPTVAPTPNATLQVVNSSEVNTAKLVTAGTGIAQVAIVNNTVAVTPTSGYSGKTSVVVQVTSDNEVTTVKVPVTVLPLAPIKPILDPVSTESTKVDWNSSPNAIGYQVFVDGKIACVTNSSQTECSVPQLLGPKADVQVISRGGSLLKSDPVPAVYTNKDPIVAGMVNFANNSYKLTASEKTKLRELAVTIKAQGFTNIEVSGHTDPNTGVDNQVLSENRAKATVAYLQKLVPKLAVKVGGYADTQRTSSAKNDVVYAADRRAEIKVW